MNPIRDLETIRTELRAALIHDGGQHMNHETELKVLGLIDEAEPYRFDDVVRTPFAVHANWHGDETPTVEVDVEVMSADGGQKTVTTTPVVAACFDAPTVVDDLYGLMVSSDAGGRAKVLVESAKAVTEVLRTLKNRFLGGTPAEEQPATNDPAVRYASDCEAAVPPLLRAPPATRLARVDRAVKATLLEEHAAYVRMILRADNGRTPEGGSRVERYEVKNQ